MAKIQKLKHNMIGDKSFYRQVITILLPIIIQNTITNIVSLVDNIMVGAVGTLQMSAVAIVNQLMFVFYLCIFGGLAGIGIFTSQLVGAGDKEGVRHTFRMKIYVGTAILIIALGIFLIFPKQLINMYLAENTAVNDASDTLGYATGYLYVMLLGLPAFTVSQIYGSTLRETGETKLPMVASVCAIFVNVVFNYILIFGNGGLKFLPFAPMGVIGAAIATSLSRYVEMFTILIATHIKKIKYDFIIGVFRSFKIPFALFKDMVKRGIPLLFNEFLWSFGMAAIMQCYSVRGIEVVAATNISTTVSNIFNVVYISMGTAIGIMVGQHLGANRIEEAKSTVWRLLTLSSVVCLLVGGILAVCAPLIPVIYNTTDHVRLLAKELLWVVAILMPFFSFCHGCYFAMRSGGKTIMTMIFDSGFIWLISYPLALCIAHLTNISIIPFFFIVQTVEIVKAVAAGILIKRGIWINNIIVN